MQILNIKNIEFEKQGKILFKIEKLSINTGDIIGLIGKNGSGKTTLLKYIDDLLKDENNISSEFLEFGESSLLKKSGGEVVVNKIRSSLLSNVELYLLDEPSTYLDYNNANKIANLIKRTPATFCIASHDRNFLNNVCTKLWIIENNTVREFNGNYHEYKFQEEIENTEYEAELQKYNKEVKKIKKSIQEMKEEQGKKSGKPKNMSGSDYRIISVKNKISKNQKRLQKKISRQEDKLESNIKPKPLKDKYDIEFLEIFKETHKKNFCIDEKNCEIDGKFLWNSPGFTFASGDKILIKGINGSGKTTFLNYVKESIPNSLQVAYFEQNGFDTFKEEKTLFEFVKESTSLNDIELRNILALLNFRGDDINKKIEVLSKGEKVKLYFVSLLFRNTDVLLLDEITNFLDVVAIEAVEKILKKYPGILIMVSHDMEFIDNVATKVINISNKEVLKFE